MPPITGGPPRVSRLSFKDCEFPQSSGQVSADNRKLLCYCLNAGWALDKLRFVIEVFVVFLIVGV